MSDGARSEGSVDGGAATLQAIGYSAACRRPVADLRDHEPPELLAAILADDVASFVQRDVTVAAMAGEAITQTLGKARVSAASVDAVLICTESFWDAEGQPSHSHEHLRDGIHRNVLIPAGLGGACIYANWMSACSNVSSSLSLARSLVLSGQHRNVMVVLSDRVQPGHSRIVRDGLGLMSDVSTAFLVTRGGPGYRIRHVVILPTLPRLTSDSASKLALSQMLRAAARRLKAAIHEITGESLDDYPVVLPDHVHSALVTLVADGLGIRRQQLSSPAKRDFAHTFSADTLLALSTLDNLRPIHPGDRVGLLNIGPWSLGVVMLEAA
jgi:3-oxoacyl-[acyl-carrier-protein] synthase III